MAIRVFETYAPSIHPTAWVDESAVVSGQVTLGSDVSVWYHVAIRGDLEPIIIGDRTNIQDHCVIHTTHSSPYSKASGVTIGEEVTIGHQVVLHGCMIHSHVLVGMRSCILDDAVIEPDVIIGAGSLVPPRKRVTSGYLWLGSPVKAIRPLTEEEKTSLRYGALHYVTLKNRHAHSLSSQ